MAQTKQATGKENALYASDLTEAQIIAMAQRNSKRISNFNMEFLILRNVTQLDALAHLMSPQNKQGLHEHDVRLILKDAIDFGYYFIPKERDGYLYFDWD